MFPDIAKSLKPKVEGRLPAIRITDLLLEVDARTRFSNAFIHLRTGRTADNKLALLSRATRIEAEPSNSILLGPFFRF